jgi:hypothetical protein
LLEAAKRSQPTITSTQPQSAQPAATGRKRSAEGPRREPPTSGVELVALLNATPGIEGFYKDSTQLRDALRKIIEGWNWPAPNEERTVTNADAFEGWFRRVSSPTPQDPAGRPGLV